MNLKVSQAQAIVILEMQRGAVLHQTQNATWLERGEERKSIQPRTLDSLKSIGMIKVSSRSVKSGDKYVLTSVGRKLTPMKS